MSKAVYYKVSYVVEGGKHPGAIINTDKEPRVGDEVSFDGLVFKIVEVDELMPPAGDFGFLHATCRFVRKADEKSS
ncbi:MAG: hypothetical protein L0332_09665 [Chloroflexi bacterium]|nr:hypothetical protein [Chloroflexota bacterium]MCI0580990.1 hypothetical protein [Chloroflexota bacterium]MCI0646329.1 hypothetical protein [Chloroflexota bacterium]MCI0726973.1 hypothetical protein [Chloroflexota bacterium]